MTTSEMRMNIRNAAGTPPRPTAARAVRGRLAAVFACLFALGAVLAVTPAEAAKGDVTRLEVTYAIVIKGLTIGRAKAEMRFADNNYVSAVDGAVTGLARLFSDATAKLAGSGHIQGSRIVPDSFDSITVEGKYESRVRMAMRGGAITELTAEPPSRDAPDRIPVTPSHKRNIVDPLSAFLVALGKPGKPTGPEACNRTIKVFDGWSRYDIQLTYKDTKQVGKPDKPGDDYNGDVFVCAARYVPVSGHRQNAKSVKDMEDNKNLEAWLAPIGETGMLVPYKFIIGTSAGDLTLRSTRFVVSQEDRRASAK